MSEEVRVTQTEEVTGQEGQSAEQGVNITEETAEQALTQKLAETEQALSRQAMEYEFFKLASSRGMTNIDSIIPFLDFSRVESDGVEELVEALTGVGKAIRKEPKTIGDPSNGGRQEKTAEMQLEEAKEKARKTGKIADRVFYSTLKQKLTGGR